MALNYKYRSVKSIILRVIRDLQLKDNLRLDDMIEWCGQALEHIGSFDQYKPEVCCFDVENYKAFLPCDYHSLSMVYYNGRPLKPASTPFGTSMVITNNETTDTATKDKLKNLSTLSSNTATICDDASYELKDGYIHTSFEKGSMCIAYQAYPTDDDGFPMIPDDESFAEACFWYIAKQLSLPDYFAGKTTFYDTADMKWQKYCGQARGVANMPSIDRLENIKNMWVRLVPAINRHSDFFINLREQEKLNL